MFARGERHGAGTREGRVLILCPVASPVTGHRASSEARVVRRLDDEEVRALATRFDPFQEIDRLFGQMVTAERAAATMPMDLYRSGDHYVLHVDLPGADPGTIDVN